MKDGDKKLNKKALAAVILCAVVLVGVICADIISGSREFSKTDVAMNTIINIRLYGKDGKENAEEIVESIKDIDSCLLSRYEIGSDISRINEAGGENTSVSPEVSEIIEKAVDVSENCSGVFDITVGKITTLWGFGGDNPTVPKDDDIQALLPYVDYSKIKFIDKGISIGDNQELDLGAVGKGAACDILRTRLNDMTTDSALISVGGSLLLYGNRSFSIGISNPEDDSKSMGTLRLSEVCVSTSGNYEQYFEKDGKTYHHILDATTGYPADNHLYSVTVICESGVLSDALSTACYILGYNDTSLNLLKKYDAEAVFITKDKIVRCTDGIAKNFEITDSGYTMGK